MKLTGAHGWALLLGVVVAWDMLAPETLSGAFARAPWWMKVGGAALVGAHLFDLVPEDRDLIDLSARVVNRARS